MALNYGQMFENGWSKAAYLKFLGRRVARIYPLYFVGTAVGFLLVVMHWSGYESGAPLGLALCFNLIMVQAWGLVQSFDVPGWSISAEWAAYLFFPALLAPTLFCRRRLAWASVIISIGVLGTLCLLPPSLVHAQHQ